MNVILSIRPKYAQLIFSGVKKYEFRKSIFSNKYIYEVYVYATSPIKKIVGVFNIGNIVKASPNELWNQFGHLSGMNEAEFFDYFHDTQIGFAIEIKNIETFVAPIDPLEQIPGFNPPQSFCYLKYSLVPECIATTGNIKPRIALSGFLHDHQSVERGLPADRPAP